MFILGERKGHVYVHVCFVSPSPEKNIILPKGSLSFKAAFLQPGFWHSYSFLYKTLLIWDRAKNENNTF